jgi:hypothetical protein
MSDEPQPGTCEVCGARALFANESRCWRHPAITSIVVRLAEGERVEIPGEAPGPASTSVEAPGRREPCPTIPR